MAITHRRYQTEEDYWRMRAFLRGVMLLNGLRETAWHVARLEYSRWHVCLNCAKVTLEDVAFLWEDGGRLIGFIMPDGGPQEAHFNIHPDYNSPELVEEMIAVAEEHLTGIDKQGRRFLNIYCPEEDKMRQQALRGHGYIKEGWVETQWRRSLKGALWEVKLPEGYTLHTVGEGLELLKRCYASGLGFHKGDIKIAVENRDDPSWYRNIQTAPLYRRDLDLTAVAPDGSIASFCTSWFDDVTRTAYFEPVATVPAHQRKGLSRALLTEGLRRLQRMGATIAFVGGFEEGPNRLYGSVFGPEHDLYETWVKRWE